MSEIDYEENITNEDTTFDNEIKSLNINNEINLKIEKDSHAVNEGNDFKVEGNLVIVNENQVLNESKTVLEIKNFKIEENISNNSETLMSNEEIEDCNIVNLKSENVDNKPISEVIETLDLSSADINIGFESVEKQKYNAVDKIIATKEDTAPKSLSEIYSEYSASWKERLKAKSLTSQRFKPILNNTGDNMVSDFGEIMSDIPVLLSRKPVCMDSSCSSASDEIVTRSKRNSKTITEASFGCGSDNDNDIAPKQTLKEAIKPKSKTATVTSFGCTFDSDDIPPSSPKLSLQKPLFVESSCNSGTVERVSRPTYRFNNSMASNNSDNVSPKMTTASTATDTDNNDQGRSSFSTQIDETYNSLESKILPFVKSPHTVELRLKGQISVFQRACIKQIATEHKLLIKQFGKGKDGYVLLRKKVEMVTAQKLFLEMKRNEIERKKTKVAQDKAKMERLLNPPQKVSSSCQVDFPDPKEEANEISKNVARKNRKKQWELKQKQLAKRHSSTQTVPDGFYLCPYCEGDIPESAQSLHYPFCLSKYRAQLQFANKSGNISKDKQSINSRTKRPISGERKARSKSRDNIKHSTMETIKKELEKIHDNDINSMVNALNELNKRCAVSGCTKKKQKTCDDCMVGYCIGHFSPEECTSSGHFNCPVAHERSEAEKLKRLGSNNPLMKTVEELTAPKFPDGALLKKQRSVRVVAPQIASTPVGETPAETIMPPNINETRTRNGPILSFERNELQKKLRNRIGHFLDRRTK